MVKYISFKIFDTEDYDNDIDILLEKQKNKFYSIVHEDYYVGVIKAELDMEEDLNKEAKHG